MSRRSAVAGPDAERPMYARLLRLRHLRPGSVHCFVFFELTVVMGALLALAELVPWWGMVALPAAVAAMVKVNDMVAGTTARGASRRASPLWLTAVDAPGVGGAAGAAVPAGTGRSGRVYGAPAGGALTTRLFRALVRGGVGVVVGRASVPAKGSRGVPGGGAAGGAPSQAEETTTLGLAHSLNVLPVTEAVDSPRQRARQSAARRYE